MQMPLYVQASGLTYHFTSRGEIIPYLGIYPDIELSEHRHISKFPLLHCSENMTVADGDKIGIYLPESEGESCHLVLESMSENPRVAITPDYCPICGAPLMKSDIGIGRCVNKACRAQIYKNTYALLRVLNITDPVVHRIINMLIALGMMDTPASMFDLSLENLTSLSIEVTDAQVFLQQVHSVRGHVSVYDFLRSFDLNIPDEKLRLVNQYFVEHHLTLKNIDLLADNTLLNDPVWSEILAVNGNRYYLAKLATILAE